MALYSPVVFPLHPIIQTSDGPRCACGSERCNDPKKGRVGKHPAVEWRELKYGDPVPRPQEGAGYGIKTGVAPYGSGVFVVDLDGPEASEKFDQLGGAPEDTYCVETGREEGGWQLYFECPPAEGPGGFLVKNTSRELWWNGLKEEASRGIDTRGEGGFVVGPGSPHRSGRRYGEGEGVIRQAPAWLLDWLRARPAIRVEVREYDGDVTDPDELAYRKALYATYLQSEAPPCIYGGGGDRTLFDVVQRGAYDLGLPTEDVLALLEEHYDHRCEPPWGEELAERVWHKAHDAKTKSTRARIEPLPRGDEVLDRIFGLEMPSVPLGGLTDLPPEKKKKLEGVMWGGWDEPIDPPTYLVHGLIPVETVGMFVAMGSSLKTWTALDIGLAVARGQPWLGRFSTRKGRVVIGDYESGLYELRRRVRLLTKGEALPNLGVWSYPAGHRIDQEDFWKVLAKEASAPNEPLQLVIIDSLAAGAPGVDENDTRAALPLKLAARFTEATGSGVLFIHHSRKDDSDDQKMVRGSTAIHAACDWIYKFENIEETASYRRMHMACTKPCMGPKPSPVHLELSDDKGVVWFDEDAARKTLAHGERTPEAIQAAIRLALANGPLETVEKIAREIGVRKELVGPELKAMEVRQEVVRLKGLGYVLDSSEARANRVKALIQRPDQYWRSEADIAKAAGLETEDVRELMRKGIICRSAEGRFMAIDN